MVNKVMPVYLLDLSKRGHRGADDNKKKTQRKFPFKEILARELAGQSDGLFAESRV